MATEERALKRADPHLVRRAMGGNCDAFGQLIHMHQEYLYRTAFLYVKNEDDALDIVQECILKAYESMGRLRRPEFFKTWLTRILINCAKLHLRRCSRISPGDVEERGAGERTSLEPAVSVEEKWDLFHAIDRLPERYRSVVILKYFNDLKISEIASVLEIPEGSVKSYLYRAKKELRVYLEEDEYDKTF
ncbi:MAG: sigma-70 family RNA polymerase sigma factor [Clostridiales bacterium]|nr:sigma-70 family RNA polymerase sigma factor [Clostridiales bacterium]